MKADQERVKSLLTDTVTLLCKNGLQYARELRVEGLLGVSIDNSDVFFVHISEKLGDATEEGKLDTTTEDYDLPVESTPKSQTKSESGRRGKSSPSRHERGSPCSTSTRPSAQVRVKQEIDHDDDDLIITKEEIRSSISHEQRVPPLHGTATIDDPSLQLSLPNLQGTLSQFDNSALGMGDVGDEPPTKRRARDSNTSRPYIVGMTKNIHDPSTPTSTTSWAGGTIAGDLVSPASHSDSQVSLDSLAAGCSTWPSPSGSQLTPGGQQAALSAEQMAEDKKVTFSSAVRTRRFVPKSKTAPTKPSSQVRKRRMATKKRKDRVSYNEGDLGTRVIRTGVVRTANYRKTYSQEALAAAYMAVKENKWSVRDASRAFGVPDQTLRDRVLGRLKTGKSPQVFSDTEELRLVAYILRLASYGYQMRVKNNVKIAQNEAVQLGKPRTTLTPRWHVCFKSRHLQINNDNLLHDDGLTAGMLNEYYDYLESSLKQYNLLNRPESMFIIHEVVIEWNRIIRVAGSRAGDCIVKGKDSMMTVLACCNAEGSALPPFIIYPGDAVEPEVLESSMPGTSVCASPDGSAGTKVLEIFLQLHLLAQAPRSHSEQPLLVFYNPLSAFNPALIQFAMTQNIILHPLPAFASRYPLIRDTTLPALLESAFKKVTEKQPENYTLSKNDICAGICSTYSEFMISEDIAAVFEKLGLFPFCNVDIATLDDDDDEEED